MNNFDFNNNNKKTEAKAIDFNVFLQDGVIIDLQIKRWRGKNKLDESELGLQQNTNPDYNDFMNKYVSLGYKNLFPKDILERISSIEVRSRKNLKEFSYESPWGRFVPLTAYDQWKEGNEKLQEDFFNIRDEIVRDYANIIERVKKDYLPLAGTVYKRINNYSINQVKEVPREFVRDFLQGILDQIPTPEEIRESFIFEVMISSLPDLVTGISSGNTNISYDSPPKRTLKWDDNDDSTPIVSNSKNENQKDIPNTEKIKKMIPKETMVGSILSQEEKEKKKKTINADINKSLLGKDNEKLEQFISNVLSQIREVSIEASNDILDSIEKNDGKMVGRASIRARNLISKVRALDFYGDATIKEHIDEIEKLLDEKPKKRSVEKIRERVQGLKDYSETSLKSINHSTTVKRMPKKNITLEPAKITTKSEKVKRTANKKPKK